MRRLLVPALSVSMSLGACSESTTTTADDCKVTVLRQEATVGPGDDQLSASCIEDPRLEPYETGPLPCEMTEEPPAGTLDCDYGPGRFVVERTNKHVACGVEQRTAAQSAGQDTDSQTSMDAGAPEPGWYFQRNPADPCKLIHFTPGAEPIEGTVVRFECEFSKCSDI